MWYLIADANGLSATSALTAGMLLILPAAVLGAHNNAMTFSPYNASRYVADVAPYSSNAAQNSQMSCGQTGIIVAAAVVGAITFVCTAGASTAAVATLIAAEAGSTAAVGAAVAGNAFAGAASALAQQSVMLASGMQQDFSWASVGEGAVGGALFSGVAAAAGAIVGASATAAEIAGAGFADIVNAATMAQAARAGALYSSRVAITSAGYAAVTSLTDAAGQGLRIASGEQQSLSWKELAAAAIAGAGIGLATGLRVSSPLMSGVDELGHIADFTIGAIGGGAAANLYAHDGHIDPNELIANVAQNLTFGLAGARAVLENWRPIPTAFKGVLFVHT